MKIICYINIWVQTFVAELSKNYIISICMVQQNE